MRTLLRKEFLQNWRLFRLPAFLLAALFFALLDPPVTKYMDEILRFAAGDVQMILPDPTGAQALTQFFSSISQIVFLVLIIVSMGIVSAEKESATTSWIVTQPVSRSNYILAKFFSMTTAIIAGVLATSLIAYLYTGTLLDFVQFGGFFAAAVAVAIYGVYLFSVTLLGSILFRTTWAAGGIGLAALFITPLVYVARGFLSPLEYSPYGLLARAQLAVAGAFDGPGLAISLLATAAVIFLLLLVSLRIFRQQELG